MFLLDLLEQRKRSKTTYFSFQRDSQNFEEMHTIFCKCQKEMFHHFTKNGQSKFLVFIRSTFFHTFFQMTGNLNRHRASSSAKQRKVLKIFQFLLQFQLRNVFPCSDHVDHTAKSISETPFCFFKKRICWCSKQ